MSKDRKTSDYYKIPGTFFKSYDVVYEDINLTSAEKVVYNHILRRSQQTGYCFEQLLPMSKAVAYSYDNTRYIVRGLKKKGYIVTTGKGTSWKIFPKQLYSGEIQGNVRESAPMRIQRTN